MWRGLLYATMGTAVCGFLSTLTDTPEAFGACVWCSEWCNTCEKDVCANPGPSPNNPPSPDAPPAPHPPPGPDDIRPGGPGSEGGEPAFGPVRPKDGAVGEGGLDLTIPTKGLAPVQWRHVRSFSQSTSGPGDTAQGYHWFHWYLGALELEDSQEDVDDRDVTWRVDANQTALFSNSGNYTFTTTQAVFAVLSHEHTGDPADTYRLEFLDGTIVVFYDFEYATTNVRGKLRYVEDAYGNRLSASYDGNGRLDYLTDPSGHYFRYGYLTSGDNSGKLSQIRAWKDSTTNDNDKLIAQVDFTYKASNDGNDSGCGLTGDLIKVVVSSHKTNETGTTFSLTWTTHYRYWDNQTFDDTTHPGHAHELKMILRPEHYQRADDALTDPLTATDAEVDDYATYRFEYDSSSRCDKMVVANGAGCAGCGGGEGDGTGTYDFTYATQSNNSRNGWAVRCKVQHNGWTRYLDLNNWGEVYADVLFHTDDDGSKPVWAVQYTRDTSTGQVTTYYTPAAISDYDVTNHSLTYNNDGLVYDYTFDANAKYMATMRVRKYSENTSAARYLGKWEYVAAPAGFGYRSRYLLDEVYTYPEETTDPAAASRLETNSDYVYYADADDLDNDQNTSEDSDLVKVIKTTLPTVTTAQNGPNVAGTRFSYYDGEGRLRWTKDEEGAVDYYSYDELSGRQTYAVQDVRTGTAEGDIRPTGITGPDQDGGVDIWADWTGAAPKDLNASPAYDFQTTGDSGDYVQNETKSLPDLTGRMRRTTAADGQQTYYAYLDGETRTYVSWDATNDKPRLPVRRVLVDRDGRTEEVIEVDPTDVTFSDPPTGGESVSDQAKWVTWSKTTYDDNLRRSTVKAYHNIPASGSGSDGTNYYTTTYAYSSDSNNKSTSVQVEDPAGGYSRRTYNPRGQLVKVELTATESDGQPTAWKTISEYFYDQATPGTGDSKGGNGYLTQVKSYYGDSDSNSSAYTYDWRGRRVLTAPPTAPYTLTKYDNLGRVVAAGTYSSAPSASADPTTTSTNRLALGETFYNNRGQVYQAKQWEIDASTGAKDASLATDTYYDRTGRVVAVKSPGGGIQVTKYNGAGWVVDRQSCTSLGNTIYSDGAFDFSSDNKIVELSRTIYLTGGRPKQVNRHEMKAGSNTTLNPDSPTSNAVTFYVRHYYDGAGRRTQTTDLGTYNGGLSGPMGGVELPHAYGSPEGRSDTYLVTTWTYDSAGRLEKVNDPDDYATKYEYDDLGRRTALIEDYGTGSELNRRTEYQYNGNGDLTQLSARDVGEYGYDPQDQYEDQVTQYVYGQAVNSRWVTEIRYPGSNGQASSNAADKVTFTYHHDGTVATRTDQNGSVITYEHDTLRRKTHERVTTVGSGVDNAVLQLVTTYDSAGRAQKLTHRDSATKDAGNVVNEVQFSFNGFGQLTKDEQEHDGAVDGSTLSVQYAWTEDGTNNHSRLNYLTYPNGRTLYAKYTHSAAATTWLDEKADAFSQMTQWAASSGSPGDVYVEYSFMGRGRMVKRQSDNDSGYTGNDTVLNFDYGTAGQYAGLDFTGRVVSAKVHQVGDTSVVRVEPQYRANRDGSPKFAEPQHAHGLGRASLYGYDRLHRLAEADVGRLNANRDDLLGEWTDPHQIVYTMDILDNLTTLDRKSSGTSAAETRTHNATNELTQRTITGEAYRYWVKDDFTDNDTVGWEVADLDNDAQADDGTWSAGSGKLNCTGTTSKSGAPDGGTGSVFLIDAAYQSVNLLCDIKLNANCDNAGLVFGYIDGDNFWAYIYSKAQQKRLIYQVSDGTWTEQWSASLTITAGTTYTIGGEVRAGRAIWTNGTVPAGQVGVWCSDSSDNEFDNFWVRDIAGPYECDGRYFSNKGSVRVDYNDSNLLEVTGSDWRDFTMVRRGFRGSEYVATFKFKWNNSTSPGWLVRWLDPGNFLAVAILQTDSKARLYQCEGDSGLATLATSGTALNLTTDNWYEAKVVVDTDAGSQRLRFWVDTDSDGDYSDETTLLSTNTVDDDWDAGYVGLYRREPGSDTQQFDDVKIGIDNNADGDILDAGDDIQIDDDFGSNAMSLSYDNNGNLTDDGVYKFVYDAWNRLRKVTRRVDAETTVAEYEYDGSNRRTQKVVSNCGPEVVGNDGGNTTVHYYYSHQWQILETRDGSNQTTRQWVWGTQYVDELILMDVNGDPTIGTDVDPDNTATGEGSENPPDKRYFYHQDRNWNVIALSEYVPSGGSGVNGRIVERYTYTPYGEFVVLKGDSGSGELGSAALTSLVGNVFFHQGLPLDQEKGQYQNRRREYAPKVQRFAQRDRLDYRDGASLYSYLSGRPTALSDPTGLALPCPGGTCLDLIENSEPFTPPDCESRKWYALLDPGVRALLLALLGCGRVLPIRCASEGECGDDWAGGFDPVREEIILCPGTKDYPTTIKHELIHALQHWSCITFHCPIEGVIQKEACEEFQASACDRSSTGPDIGLGRFACMQEAESLCTEFPTLCGREIPECKSPPDCDYQRFCKCLEKKCGCGSCADLPAY